VIDGPASEKKNDGVAELCDFATRKTDGDGESINSGVVIDFLFDDDVDAN